MGIGQEAHIEDHVRVERHAIFETEAEAGDEEALGFLLVPETREDVSTQLVHVEVGGVDERVGDVADGVKQLALFNDGAPHRFAAAERVRAARLRVAADENRVLGIEKNHARLQQLLDAFQDLGQTVKG